MVQEEEEGSWWSEGEGEEETWGWQECDATAACMGCERVGDAQFITGFTLETFTVRLNSRWEKRCNQLYQLLISFLFVFLLFISTIQTISCQYWKWLPLLLLLLFLFCFLSILLLLLTIITIIIFLNQLCHKTQNWGATSVRHFMLHCNWKVQINFSHRLERSVETPPFRCDLCASAPTSWSKNDLDKNSDSNSVNTL